MPQTPIYRAVPQKLALLLFASILLLFWMTPAHALVDVTLAWDATPGVAGYKLYYKTGSPGPPYDGTGATIDSSPTIIDSPIDVGNVTQVTIHLPDGEYRFSLTGYNEYGESGYATEVVIDPLPQGIDSVDTDSSFCKKQKVKAVKKLCSRLLFAYSREMTAPYNNDLNTVVENLETILESRWENAESRALRKGDNCPTAAMEYINDKIVLAVEDMFQQISDGIDLENKVGRRLGERLLKAMQKKCIRSFENKTDTKFQLRWNRAIDRAEKKGLIYYGPSNSDIADIIDVVVTDVFADIQ